MLGTEPSLLSSEFHPDWGIFPRVTAAIFDQVKTRFVLTVSAIEFYMCECFDLLGARGPVGIDSETHEPFGETRIELTGPGDLMPVLAQVLANRSTRSTRLNAASAEHSGSSRSHAALILTLQQVDAKSDFVATTFTLVDLAGAERLAKLERTIRVLKPNYEEKFAH